MGDYVGITFYPGTDVERFESLLCSLLSNFDVEKRIKDPMTNYDIERNGGELMNFDDFIKGTEYEYYNLGNCRYNKEIKYETLKINVEFICDGISNITDKLKNIIIKFNELYYGNNNLNNLYGSKNHVSVMCSRNYFFKKHKQDYKMIIDDDDMTTGLNNYKQCFNYARKKYKKFHGKINMIYLKNLNKSFVGTCTYIYLPSNTEIWQPVNFMRSEDSAFYIIHQLCKDMYTYNYIYEETKLPVIYIYLNSSDSGNYKSEIISITDLFYYFIMYVLSTKSLIGANFLILLLYKEYKYCQKIEDKNNEKITVSEFKILDKYSKNIELLIKGLENINNNHKEFKYEYETRNLNTIDFIKDKTILYSFIPIINFMADVKTNINDDMEYSDNDVIKEKCELIEFEDCEFIFKNILDIMSKNKCLHTIDDKSNYGIYRPDYIVKFKNEGKQEIKNEFITDRNLRKIKIDDKLDIEKFNSDLLKDELYILHGGDKSIIKIIIVVIVVIIVIVIVVIIIKNYKNINLKSLMRLK